MRQISVFPLFLLFLFAFVVAAAGCGGGGGSTFDLVFAPSGGGLADGQIPGVPFAPSVNRDITLAAGVAVQGRVTDDTGAPLDGVKVSFLPAPGAQEMDRDTTNAAGDYAVGLSAGSWIAILDSGTDALGTLTVSGLAVVEPGPVTLDFAFPAPVAITGRVLDASGFGIAGAEVEFVGAASGSRVQVVCDAAGDYAAALVPDTYEAIVRPVGAAAATHLAQRFPGIAVGALPVARDFALSRGVALSGTVFTNTGLPLQEDTEIKVILPVASPFLAPDKVRASDVDGTYALGPVPTGNATFQLKPPDDSGFPKQSFSRQIVGPVVQTEDFTLAAGFVLSGSIVRDDGFSPEDNVKVEPVPTDGSPAPEDTTTNAAGFYSVSLFPGTYRLTLTPKTDNLQLPEVRTIRITASMTLDVTLQRGVMVSGTVREPNGVTPAGDVRVAIPGALGADDVTDGAGKYSFLAPAGTHTVTFVAQDGPFEGVALDPAAGVAVVSPGPQTLDFTLVVATTGSTVVTGTVFAPDGATPVTGVKVQALDAAGGLLGRGVTDATGAYVIVIP